MFMQVFTDENYLIAEPETKYFKCKEPFSGCNICPEFGYRSDIDLPVCDLHNMNIINKEEKILLNEEIKHGDE